MPHSVGITAPFIVALDRGKRVDEGRSRIDTDTYIKLDTDTANCVLFFTTDGITPDPLNRYVSGVEKTFKYKGPFKLRPGTRIITAVAYSRSGHSVSKESKRIFQVEEATVRNLILDCLSDSDTVTSSDFITHRGSSHTGGHLSQRSYLNEYLRRESEEYARHRPHVLETDSETSISDVYTDVTLRTDQRPIRQYHSRPHTAHSHRSVASDAELSSYFEPPRSSPSRRSGYTSCLDTDDDNYYAGAYRQAQHTRNRSRSKSPARSPARQSFYDSAAGTPRVRFMDSVQVAPPERVQWVNTDTSYQIPPSLPLRSFSAWSGPLITETNNGGSRPTSSLNRNQDGRRSPFADAARESQKGSLWKKPENSPKSKQAAKHSTAASVASSSSSDASTGSTSALLSSSDSSMHATSSSSKSSKNAKVSGNEKKEKCAKEKKDEKEGNKKEDKKEDKKKDSAKGKENVEIKDGKTKTKKVDLEENKNKTKTEKDTKEKNDDGKKKKYKVVDDDDGGNETKGVSWEIPSDVGISHRNKDEKESFNLLEEAKKHSTPRPILHEKSSESNLFKLDGKAMTAKSNEGNISFRSETQHGHRNMAAAVDSKNRPIVRKRRSDRIPESTSGLNFINESGTQINLWGVTSDDIMETVGNAMPRSGSVTGVSRPISPQTSAAGSVLSSIDFSKATPNTVKKTVPKPRPLSQPKSLLTSAKPSAKPGTIKKAQQTEQQSIMSFPKKKFFKGWHPTEKPEADVDARPTVSELGAETESKTVYEEILETCLRQKKLWEDPDFPASDSSLFFSRQSAKEKIQWKRPKEINPDAQMFVGGASRFDVKQGCLGNCWLLAAVASLSCDEKLLQRVVPSGQSFTDGYAGVFHFRFWQYGAWVDICIDDRLPTTGGRLIYMHSGTANEFWSALLEKAYAKLAGSYESLCGGLASEAMVDFTGGVVERFDFSEELPHNMFQILLKAMERDSLISCAIEHPGATEKEQQLDNGLVLGHAYSITNVKIITEMDGSSVQLVRVRNPWGNDCEWKGAWSDESVEWKSISEKDKSSIGLSFEHDGEFWMDFKDFITYFNRLEICNLGPDELLDKDDNDIVWNKIMMEGSWRKNVNAGGCRNYPKTAWSNPQYTLQVTDVDDNDDENLGTVIVSLMQKGTRKRRQLGQTNLTIGYDIFQASGANAKVLDKETFLKHPPIASVPAYIDMREVGGRHRLPEGEYIIMPTTFDPNEEGSFLLRIFTEKEHRVKEVDKETGRVTSDVTDAVMAVELPSEAEDTFHEFGGDDGVIDAYELYDILNGIFNKYGDVKGFDINLCRGLVALRDIDHTGKLNLEEFKLLWKDLETWKALQRLIEGIDPAGMSVSRKAVCGCKRSARTLANIARVEELICSQESNPKSPREIEPAVGILRSILRRIAKHDLNLIDVIICCRAEVSQALVDSTIDQWSRRVNAVIWARGGHIEYLFN